MPDRLPFRLRPPGRATYLYLLLGLLWLKPATLDAQNVFNGDLTLANQVQVDSFSYTEVTGYLDISNTTITNLNGLSSLTSVGGSVLIEGNDSLSNLDGLSSLTSVGGDVEMQYNLSLSNLNGLSSLTSVGGDVIIDKNFLLSNLNGLSSLTSVGGDVFIYGNSSLSNLNGLSSLTSVGGSVLMLYNDFLSNLDGLSSLTSVGGDVEIHYNFSLSNLDGLSSLTLVWGTLYIVGNVSLSNLDGLSSLTSVWGGLIIGFNDSLSTLDGLSSLTSVERGVQIVSNPVLSDFCGLYPLLDGGGLAGAYNVSDNASNPTQAQIISGGPCGFVNIHTSTDTRYKVHPNPAREWLTVTVPAALGTAQVLTLTDLSGRVLLSETLAATQSQARLSLSGLPDGLYLLRVADEAGLVTVSKVIKE